MPESHIRRTRRSKLYMAPVLLDHASMKRLMMSMVLALAVVFLSGYVVGFKKAEVKLASFVETNNIALPETMAKAHVSMESVIPLLAEPGESIDVDSADAEPTITIKKNPQSVVKAEATKTSLIESKKTEPILIHEAPVLNLPPDVVHPVSIGGPAPSDPEQGEELLIQDTSNQEAASYTIQVGMYGQLENAEQKVEALIAMDLSAYIIDYINKKNEIRYNVRFGYFADRISARKALKSFGKEYSGSGYIVRMRPPATMSANSGEHPDG